MFQAIETDYVLALLDNGLACRLHVEEEGNVIELSHRPSTRSIQLGLLSTNDESIEMC